MYNVLFQINVIISKRIISNNNIKFIKYIK